jgi:hypothetical protein
MQCYAEFRKQAHYFECHYAECHHAECRGANFTAVNYVCNLKGFEKRCMHSVVQPGNTY